METTTPGANTTPAPETAAICPEIPSSGRGKIAALDKGIRQELNERLENGEQAAQILPWLNALPCVKERLKLRFKGIPISAQNLSAWRRGGFQYWLWQSELLSDSHLVRENVEDMQDSLQYCCDRERPTLLVDDLFSQFTAQVASFMLHWDGAPDDPQWAKFMKVGNFLMKIQSASHRAEREAVERPERLRITLEEHESRVRKEADADARRESYEQRMAEEAEEEEEKAKAKKARKKAQKKTPSSSVKANQGSDPKPAEPAIIENVEFGKENTPAGSSSGA